MGVADTDRTLTANGYLVLIAALGMALWFGTQAVVLFVTFEVTSAVGVTGGVIAVWLAYAVGHRVVARQYGHLATLVSTPFLLWSVLAALAFLANGAGLLIGNTDLGQALTWAPWATVFAVGYLATGVLVKRGGVYLTAGVCSALFIPVALVTGVAGYHFAVLGALHGVPMLIDAARGGRQLVDGTTPAVEL